MSSTKLSTWGGVHGLVQCVNKSKVIDAHLGKSDNTTFLGYALVQLLQLQGITVGEIFA